GLRTAMAAGCMSRIGDGRGFLMIRGAGLLITTAAGCMSTAAGDGGRDRLTGTRSIVPSGRRLTFRSLDSAVDLGLDSDLVSVAGAELAGFRSDRVIISTRGMAATAGAT